MMRAFFVVILLTVEQQNAFRSRFTDTTVRSLRTRTVGSNNEQLRSQAVDFFLFVS
jgi:hypothetical protein